MSNLFRLQVQVRAFISSPASAAVSSLETPRSESPFLSEGLEKTPLVSPRYQASGIAYQFLVVCDPTFKLKKLKKIIVKKFKKLYPNEEPISIGCLRDHLNCDLDEDYSVQSVFNDQSTVLVMLKHDNLVRKLDFDTKRKIDDGFVAKKKQRLEIIGVDNEDTDRLSEMANRKVTISKELSTTGESDDVNSASRNESATSHSDKNEKFKESKIQQKVPIENESLNKIDSVRSPVVEYAKSKELSQKKNAKSHQQIEKPTKEPVEQAKSVISKERPVKEKEIVNLLKNVSEIEKEKSAIKSSHALPHSMTNGSSQVELEATKQMNGSEMKPNDNVSERKRSLRGSVAEGDKLVQEVATAKVAKTDETEKAYKATEAVKKADESMKDSKAKEAFTKTTKVNESAKAKKVNEVFASTPNANESAKAKNANESVKATPKTNEVKTTAKANANDKVQVKTNVNSHSGPRIMDDAELDDLLSKVTPRKEDKPVKKSEAKAKEESESGEEESGSEEESGESEREEESGESESEEDEPGGKQKLKEKESGNKECEGKEKESSNKETGRKEKESGNKEKENNQFNSRNIDSLKTRANSKLHEVIDICPSSESESTKVTKSKPKTFCQVTLPENGAQYSEAVVEAPLLRLKQSGKENIAKEAKERLTKTKQMAAQMLKTKVESSDSEDDFESEKQKELKLPSVASLKSMVEKRSVLDSIVDEHVAPESFDKVESSDDSDSNDDAPIKRPKRTLTSSIFSDLTKNMEKNSKTRSDARPPSSTQDIPIIPIPSQPSKSKARKPAPRRARKSAPPVKISNLDIAMTDEKIHEIVTDDSLWE